MDTGEEEPQRIRYSRGVSVADDTAEEEPQQKNTGEEELPQQIK